MTEKEKRDLGLLYHCDNELGGEFLACKKKCHAYNSLDPTDFAGKKALLCEILGKGGEDAFIMSPFWCDYGYNIEVGKGFSANHNLVILDCAKVRFGDHVLIGPDCGIYTAGHPLNCVERKSGEEFARPIIVGSNVWIGGGTRILPGVTIGDNTIIGAGSVVTKNIPSGVIAMGNPCRVYRALTEEELAEAKA